MRILILGASGFIGAHLCKYAEMQGHNIVALCRSGVVAGLACTVLKWSLGESIPPASLDGVNCAIHLAHDFDGEAGARRTFEGVCAAIAEIRKAGVAKQLFYSSYSAGEHAESLYGRTKWAIENQLRDNSDIVTVRPGLVMGNGGIYGRIRKWAQRWPVIPLPDGGRGQVPVITVERLCRETLAIAAMPSVVLEANLFEPSMRTLRELVLDAAAEVGRRPLLIPVPVVPVLIGLRIGELLHLPLPVNVDNLTGFLANQCAQHVSTLK